MVRVPTNHTNEPLYLQYDGQDTCDNPEQSHTFYEGGCQDHVRTDITRCFRLTGDAFNSATTDLTDTYACAESCETCANGATSLSQT